MAQVQTKVAKRYAAALFRSTNLNQAEAMRDALNAAAAAWKGSKELRDAMNNPSVSAKDKVAAASAIAAQIKPGDSSFVNFLSLLAENGRLSGLPKTAESFSALVDEAKKLLSLVISSAFPLADEEKKGIAQQIEKDFGSMASISWTIDKDLIGGLLVKAGDKLLDSSVRGSLERLQSSLLGAAA